MLEVTAEARGQCHPLPVVGRCGAGVHVGAVLAVHPHHHLPLLPRGLRHLARAGGGLSHADHGVARLLARRPPLRPEPVPLFLEAGARPVQQFGGCSAGVLGRVELSTIFRENGDYDILFVER